MPPPPRRRAPAAAGPSLSGAPGLVALLVVALAPGVAGAQSACVAEAGEEVAAVVRSRLEVLAAHGAVTAGGEGIRAVGALPELYARRGWAPAWVAGGRPSPCARQLVGALDRVGEDGLEPDDYHRDALGPLLATAEAGRAGAAELADLDLLLTDAFLTLGSHLSQGRVNPVSLEPEWLANRRRLDMTGILEEALASRRVEAALVALRPSQPGYARLRRTLARLRTVSEAGGWGRVDAGPTVHPGEEDLRVPALRRRLRAAGDLAPGADTLGALLDVEVAAAVAAFQLRHGLEPDSAVGARTLAALNVPVDERIRQVTVNLERWRWLPAELGATHIRVNIADFRVEVWEGRDVALAMRAVVGRTYRQTPSFSAPMTYLVLAPSWHVPPGIASADKLPELKRNPGYLQAQGMVLLDQATHQPVDPTTVDFQELDGAAFNRRYRIRQAPGPLNALGQVKFMFPNRHNVYLHDTPSRELFRQAERAASSGCIRLEHPLDLADYLLRGNPEWPPERIRSVAGGRQETTVRLEEPVPVHLLYWTAFVDDEGRTHFRTDLYGRDGRVRRALDEEPPEL